MEIMNLVTTHRLKPLFIHSRVIIIFPSPLDPHQMLIMFHFCYPLDGLRSSVNELLCPDHMAVIVFQ